MNILIWLIMGGIIGWLASVIMRSQEGVLLNIVVGIVGALIGGWLISPMVGAATINQADFPTEEPPLISPRVDRLLENVDSPYASVIVAAKRARQINSYYHNLGEGTFEEFPPPMVDTGSKNYLTIALEEVAGGKVKYRYRG